VQGYRSWARTEDRRSFVSPDFKGDPDVARVEFARVIERGDLPDWLAGRVKVADIRDFGTEEDFTPTRAVRIVMVGAYAAALAFDIWLVFVHPSGDWRDRTGTVLAIVGILGFGITFLNTTELAKQLPPFFLPDLTSPRLKRFIAGNLRLLATSTDFALAVFWGRDPWGHVSAGRMVALFPVRFLIAVLQLSVALSWFVLTFAYLILVVPFAYIAYAVVSLPLTAIISTDETKWTRVNPWGLRPTAIVASHMFELRTFIVGTLGTFLAAVLRATSFY
jgi:hypothetical protein